MSKVIFINAKDKKVEIKGAGSLEELQHLVGGYIECIARFRDPQGLQHGLYVNEEARIKENSPKYGFNINGNGVLIGNGFVMAQDEKGDSTDPTMTVAMLESQVRWLDLTNVAFTPPKWTVQ